MKILNLIITRERPRPMIETLKEMYGQKELVGVEIGVQSGINALSILKSLKIKKLYLIDPYVAYAEYLECMKLPNRTPVKIQESKCVAIKRLSRFKDKIKFIKKFSEDAVKEIPDDLDFVYIDANHAYNYVMSDIKLYYPKIKKGGVIGGHDFNRTVRCINLGHRVFEAVTDFITESGEQLFFQKRDWWIVKGYSFDESLKEHQRGKRGL